MRARGSGEREPVELLVADPGEYVADGAARQAARTLDAATDADSDAGSDAGSDAAWPEAAGRWVEASAADLAATAEMRAGYAALRDASA